MSEVCLCCDCCERLLNAPARNYCEFGCIELSGGELGCKDAEFTEDENRFCLIGEQFKKGLSAIVNSIEYSCKNGELVRENRAQSKDDDDTTFVPWHFFVIILGVVVIVAFLAVGAVLRKRVADRKEQKESQKSYASSNSIGSTLGARAPTKEQKDEFLKKQWVETEIDLDNVEETEVVEPRTRNNNRDSIDSYL